MPHELVPPPSLVDLVKEDAQSDITWKTWLNNLYEFVLENMSKDFYFEVAAGRVAGHTPLNRIIHASDIGTSLVTLWEENLLYTYSSTADITQVSSDNAGDTHTITVIGLDTDWGKVTQTVSLSETSVTPATLGVPLIRVNEVYNTNGTDTLGNVYVWVPGGGHAGGVPTVAAAIRARMSILGTKHNERSVSSVYSVPANKSAYIIFGKASASDAKAIELTFWIRPFGGVFQLAHHVDFKDNSYDYFFKLPAGTVEKSDIEIRATSSASGTEVSAAYDIVLVDN